jgi:hypothetical protein
VRLTRPETRNWHFVNIPENAAGYEPVRDCPTGDCAIARIEFYRNVLADPNKSVAERLEAVKFIVHLVGDIHQPLHCSDPGNDLFGNRVRVRLPSGVITDLHRVWDSQLILYANLSDRDLLEGLIKTIETTSIPKIQEGTPATWAAESHSLAHLAYAFPNTKAEEHVLDLEYYSKSFSVVDSQLVKAGLRLARFLNDIFDGQAASVQDGRGDPRHRKEAALAVVSKLIHGDYEGVRENFSVELRSEVSAESLAAKWGVTIRLLGAYESQDEPIITYLPQTDMDLVSIRCRMGKGVLTVSVYYSRDGKIAGFWIQPSR